MNDEFKQLLMSDLKDWLEDNYLGKVTMQDIADQLGTHIPVMYELFFEHFGCTPGTYLIKKRLEKGKELISKGTRPTIACNYVGYKHFQSFRTAYREHFGELPEVDFEESMDIPTMNDYGKETMDRYYPYELRIEILRYLNENIKTNIPYGDVEAKFKLPNRSLNEMFLHFYNLTYIEWRRDVRVSIAKRKIRSNPSISLSELAEEVGSCSSQYLSKQFKEVYGIAPKQYAKKLRGLCVN